MLMRGKLAIGPTAFGLALLILSAPGCGPATTGAGPGTPAPTARRRATKPPQPPPERARTQPRPKAHRPAQAPLTGFADELYRYLKAIPPSKPGAAERDVMRAGLLWSQRRDKAARMLLLHAEQAMLSHERRTGARHPAGYAEDAWIHWMMVMMRLDPRRALKALSRYGKGVTVAVWAWPLEMLYDKVRCSDAKQKAELAYTSHRVKWRVINKVTKQARLKSAPSYGYLVDSRALRNALRGMARCADPMTGPERKMLMGGLRTLSRRAGNADSSCHIPRALVYVDYGLHPKQALRRLARARLPPKSYEARTNPRCNFAKMDALGFLLSHYKPKPAARRALARFFKQQLLRGREQGLRPQGYSSVHLSLELMALTELLPLGPKLVAAKVDRLRKVWRARWKPTSTIDPDILRTLAELELKLLSAGLKRPDPCQLLTTAPKPKLDAREKQILAAARRLTAAVLLKRCPKQARPLLAQLPFHPKSWKPPRDNKLAWKPQAWRQRRMQRDLQFIEQTLIELVKTDRALAVKWVRQLLKAKLKPTWVNRLAWPLVPTKRPLLRPGPTRAKQTAPARSNDPR